MLDATSFADPEFIDTTMRRYESSPSTTESESGEDDVPEERVDERSVQSDEEKDDYQSSCTESQREDVQSVYSDDRITPMPRNHNSQEALDNVYSEYRSSKRFGRTDSRSSIGSSDSWEQVTSEMMSYPKPAARTSGDAAQRSNND